MIREISTRAAHVGWALLATNIFFAWLGTDVLGVDTSLAYGAFGLLLMGTVALFVLLIVTIVKKWKGALPLVFALLFTLGIYPCIIGIVMFNSYYGPHYNTLIDKAEGIPVDETMPVP
jgi:ABC-type transport system involved in multi-copper enzyme maturation permease subunit